MGKPIAKFGRTFDEKTIVRLNELFYDVEAPHYGHHAGEILVLELPRYKRFLTKFSREIFGTGGKTIVDMATGNGFVPLQLRPFLHSDDTLICLDLSEEILDECRKKLSAEAFTCEVQYKKTDGLSFPLSDNSVDILTLNSALHHMPNTTGFLKEADRVVRKGGMFIIGHESNAAFQKNHILWTIYRIVYTMYHPGALREKFGKKLFGSAKKAMKISAEEQAVAKYLNESLMNEGLISSPLSKHQLDLLFEIHSVEGFDIAAISRELGKFELRYVETYNHLWWIYLDHYKNPILALMNFILGKIYPRDGKTMLLMYRKVR
jgi:ubiquinone/menaquinone biosynthesis C-methylase UbiE